MNIYHYTDVRNYWSIKNGNPKANKLTTDGHWINEAPPGLRPMSSEGRFNQQLNSRAAIFCLLEPQPLAWINNQDFKDMWKRLDHQELLLTLDVNPNDPNIYVADAGHIQGFLYRDTYPSLPTNYKHLSLSVAESKYAITKILLSDYLQREVDLNYSLPEVLVEKSIPIDRIAITAFQPELFEILKNYRGDQREIYIRSIGHIPELSTWLGMTLKEIGLNKENDLPKS
jgi:hypothetical protein